MHSTIIIFRRNMLRMDNHSLRNQTFQFFCLNILQKENQSVCRFFFRHLPIRSEQIHAFFGAKNVHLDTYKAVLTLLNN